MNFSEKHRVGSREWVALFESFCEKHQGKFRYVRHSSAKDSFNDYSCAGSFSFGKGIELKITQHGEGTPSFVVLRDLKLTYTFASPRLMDTYCYRKGWWNRLFSKPKFKSGFRDFDDEFIVESDYQYLAEKIFRDKCIADFFLEREFIHFSIFSVQGDVTFSLKDIRGGLYEMEEMESFYDIFLLIISKLSLVRA